MTVSKHKDLVPTSDHDTRLLLQIPRKSNGEESRAMSGRLASQEASKESEGQKGKEAKDLGKERRRVTGLDWTGKGWTGPDWTGLGWTGLGWAGLDYCGEVQKQN
jgi:hypothetical protein